MQALFRKLSAVAAVAALALGAGPAYGVDRLDANEDPVLIDDLMPILAGQESVEELTFSQAGVAVVEGIDSRIIWLDRTGEAIVDPGFLETDRVAFMYSSHAAFFVWDPSDFLRVHIVRDGLVIAESSDGFFADLEVSAGSLHTDQLHAFGAAPSGGDSVFGFEAEIPPAGVPLEIHRRDVAARLAKNYTHAQNAACPRGSMVGYYGWF